MESMTMTAEDRENLHAEEIDKVARRRGITGGQAEWDVATRNLIAQLTPEQQATLTDAAIWNLVDISPAGLARGKSLLHVLLHAELERMEDVGIVARRN